MNHTVAGTGCKLRRLTVPKEVRALIKKARKQGWSVEPSGSGHVLLRSPKGELVVVSSSCSDRRAWRNTRSELEKRGVR